MPAYLITITMPDGSQGQHSGLYADGFEATTLAQEAFPEAKRVSAQPLVLRSARAVPIGPATVLIKKYEGARA